MVWRPTLNHLQFVVLKMHTLTFTFSKPSTRQTELLKQWKSSVTSHFSFVAEGDLMEIKPWLLYMTGRYEKKGKGYWFKMKQLLWRLYIFCWALARPLSKTIHCNRWIFVCPPSPCKLFWWVRWVVLRYFNNT